MNKQIANNELWSDKTTECNWPDATKFAEKLNKEKHLGRTNWRVPKLWELLRACDLKIEGFEEVSWFWSSSGNVGSSGNAWYVSFSNGNVYNVNKYNDRHVRCVASEMDYDKIATKDIHSISHYLLAAKEFLRWMRKIKEIWWPSKTQIETLERGTIPILE